MLEEPFMNTTEAHNEIALSFTAVEENQLALGQSKIGGRPDLPPGTEWFRDKQHQPLCFVAQINLSDITFADKEKILPQEGILYFFFATDPSVITNTCYENNADKLKIFFWEESLNLLQRLDFPSDLESHCRFKSCQLSFIAADNFPAFRENIPDKMLGYADAIHGESMAYELNKISPCPWQLLLQVTTHEEMAEMFWCDLGVVYFWITVDDLKNKRFDRCQALLET
jgi:uncharacterized protein YwqG